MWRALITYEKNVLPPIGEEHGFLSAKKIFRAVKTVLGERRKQETKEKAKREIEKKKIL